MEEKPNKQNSPGKPENRPAKKPYYKKRYKPQPTKKKFWSADKIVSLSAMSIALFTLVVLLYQSHILNKQYELTVKQQKASVLPYIQLFNGGGENWYSIKIQNKGLGPAFIKGLYIKEGDSTFFHYNLYNLYEEQNSDTVYSYNSGSIFDGLVLSPGEEWELFSAGGGSSGLAKISNFFDSYFGRGSKIIFIEYESVFGDTWITTSGLENKTKEEYGDFEVFYYDGYK
ncbi:hypothetical protein QYS49_05730 [Marivirga salinae]|uniref:Uncharacterized protein n=1 Tax=Marivirga salinarum TaxID=3059078 RepID=A0AA49J9I8_9BACT|nr:hypothetical protein [Marivirga sp. BDSF4-3]WKK76776.1 hypothetical protein QYS49_05730 [Marivirga sp. BDSF4-3]